MRLIHLVVPIAFAVSLGVPREAEARRLDSTTWALTGTERLKLSGEKAQTNALPATALTVDAVSRMVLANTDFTLSGAYSDRPRRHFTAKPDAATIEGTRAHLIGVVMSELGATEVRVRSLRFTMSGNISKDGQSISVRCRAVMAGRARVDGRWGSGVLTDTLSFTGYPGM